LLMSSEETITNRGLNALLTTDAPPI